MTIENNEDIGGNSLTRASGFLAPTPQSLFQKELHDFGVGDAAQNLHQLTQRMWRRINDLKFHQQNLRTLESR